MDLACCAHRVSAGPGMAPRPTSHLAEWQEQCPSARTCYTDEMSLCLQRTSQRLAYQLCRGELPRHPPCANPGSGPGREGLARPRGEEGIPLHPAALPAVVS